MSTKWLGAGVAALALAGAPAASALTLEGTWSNTTFGSSGPVTIEIEVTDQLSVSADFGGNVFGGMDPAPISFSVPFNSSGSTAIDIADHPVFGDVTGTVQPGGQFDLTADPPVSFITSARVTGTFDGQSLDATYSVTFPEGPPAVGTISASAVPEPAALALLTAGWIALLRRRA
jgi:hypothetical protein